jgi:hypothetical protein
MDRMSPEETINYIGTLDRSDAIHIVAFVSGYSPDAFQAAIDSLERHITLVSSMRVGQAASIAETADPDDRGDG